MTRELPLILVLASALLGCGSPEPAGPAPASDPAAAATGTEPVVNVYTSRHYDTDQELNESFEQQTGIKVNVIEGDSAALLERLRREGERSPADLFVTVDAGRLHQAVQEGIFQPVQSELLNQRVPEHLRHPEGLWFGLTKRARVIVYAKDRVKEGEISTYEALAEPGWQGRVLIRSSSNIYNQSLMGSILEAHGEAAAETWCTGVVANMARTPQGGDRDQIRAVAAGEGDVAVVNTYYLGQMLAAEDKPEDQAAGAAVTVIFPNQGQEDRGTHVNLSGAGVVKGAPNRDNAVRYLEYLTSPEAQAIMVSGTKEYPVTPGVELEPELAAFGPFKEDELNASVFGGHNKAALMIMDRCGWR